MIVDSAYVVQIESFEVLNGGMVTTMILSDEDDNIHYLIYPAEATDIYLGDYIGCVAYPIGFTSYEKVRKTTTKCTVLFGCFVSK